MSSVIRQEGESQNECFKKIEHVKFSEKQTFFYAVRTCAYQGVKNVRFSENLRCLVFLEHPFWDSPFCLITDGISMEKIYNITWCIDDILINWYIDQLINWSIQIYWWSKNLEIWLDESILAYNLRTKIFPDMRLPQENRKL